MSRKVFRFRNEYPLPKSVVAGAVVLAAAFTGGCRMTAAQQTTQPIVHQTTQPIVFYYVPATNIQVVGTRINFMTFNKPASLDLATNTGALAQGRIGTRAVEIDISDDRESPTRFYVSQSGALSARLFLSDSWLNANGHSAPKSGPQSLLMNDIVIQAYVHEHEYKVKTYLNGRTLVRYHGFHARVKPGNPKEAEVYDGGTSTMAGATPKSVPIDPTSTDFDWTDPSLRTPGGGAVFIKASRAEQLGLMIIKFPVVW